MVRENRTKGFFVGFAFSSDAEREIGSFFRKTGKVIVPLTVQEILDEELAMKLAQAGNHFSLPLMHWLVDYRLSLAVS